MTNTDAAALCAQDAMGFERPIDASIDGPAVRRGTTGVVGTEYCDWNGGQLIRRNPVVPMSTQASR